MPLHFEGNLFQLFVGLNEGFNEKEEEYPGNEEPQVMADSFHYLLALEASFWHIPWIQT